MSRKGLAAIALLCSWGLAGNFAAASPESPEGAREAPAASGKLVRDGVAIQFEARPAAGGAELIEGGLTNIRFTMTDAASGKPLTGLVPGAWLDLAQVIAGRDGEQKECKDKIALYLKGVLGVRPMLDLNSYYLMVLNKDPSITVVDPLMSVAGTTSTLTRIMLKRAPMDWTKSADGRQLFVSMPSANQVAVVDAVGFRVTGNVDAGSNPVRVALQPDGRYLWVGNNARDEADSGVTVIDTRSLQPVKSIATGRGHHEIAFGEDGRHAFVSNRDSGTVSVIDIATLKRLDDIATGPRPISVASSTLSKAIYVADGEAGTINVIDASSRKLRKVIEAKRGLGPVRFTPDGRYGFALNTLENTATVIDAGTDEIVHSIEVSAEPYQVTFTQGYAYVRGLATERVTMVNLGSLGKGREPTVQGFAAGAEAPKLAGDLPIATSLAAKADDSSVFVVNPVNNTTYFYMEGMNAPMTGYLNRGHTARAVTVVDRSMNELKPGVFTTQVVMPTSGRFDVAIMLDRPQILHCFEAEVKGGEATAAREALPKMAHIPATEPVVVPATVPVRFRLTNGREDKPMMGIGDLQVRYFLAAGSPRKVAAVSEVGEGVYEAQIEVSEAGAYYVHVESSSLSFASGSPTYFTVRTFAAKAAGSPAAAAAK